MKRAGILALVGLVVACHGAVILNNEDNSAVVDNEMLDEEFGTNSEFDFMDKMLPGVTKDPCCSPDQWEGDAYETIQYVTMGRHPRPHDLVDDVQHGRPHPRPRPEHHEMTDVMHLYGDFKNNRVAVMQTLYSKEGARNVTVIVDGGKQVMFVILPDKKFCKKIPYAGNVTGQCVPPTSKFMGSAKFGLGDNSLSFDSYGFRFVGKAMAIEGIVSVTSDTCAPIGESGRGRRGRTAFQYGASYVNLKAGISDPKAFTPPDFCADVEMDTNMDDVMEHAVVQFASRKFML